MPATPTSAEETLRYLRDHLPGFAALRWAAARPAPLGRVIAGRRLSHLVDERAHPAQAFAAIRLVQKDDRAFCRAVRLEGWRGVADEERAVFRLLDDGGLSWPVGLRALLLFAGAGLTPDTPRRVQPPRSRAATAPAASDGSGQASGEAGRLWDVSTQYQGEGVFRVAVRGSA